MNDDFWGAVLIFIAANWWWLLILLFTVGGTILEFLGDTFSAFTPWDRKTEAEHVEDVRELARTWRERHASQGR